MLSAASHRGHDPKFGRVFVRGEGARLWDVEGREYFDLTCGYSAANFGHAFQPLVEAAKKQLCQLTHLTQEPFELRSQLAEQLIQVCGFELGSAKVHFNLSGARAIESAWKAAIAYRPGRIISLAPSYHGRSLATAQLSDTTLVMPPLCDTNMLEVRPASEFPYCAACPLELNFPTCGSVCIEPLLKTIERDWKQISAILVEPALGARGYVFPPPEVWQRLRQCTAKHGITMIADEIQMGLGRCGAMLLSRNQDWQADLVVLGKSLGGGVTPISAVVGRSELLDAIPLGSESETFACTPLAAAVALEVLHQLQCGDWIERGVALGQELRNFLSELQIQGRNWPVEGQGATAVVEFWDKQVPLAISQQSAREFADACVAAGLLIHYSGPKQTRVVFIPPLTLTACEVAEIKLRLQQSAASVGLSAKTFDTHSGT